MTQSQTVRRNIVLFVADGLRHGAVDASVMPTFAELRKNGVDFVNSHSVFPTITTVNASVIATGHYPGDTGIFGNTLYGGFPGIAAETFSPAPGIESDLVLADLNERFSGNVLGEQTLLAAAREAGFNTAAIGKLGPTLIQDITQANSSITPENIQTVIIDDRTGVVDSKTGLRVGMPLPRQITARILGDPYLRQSWFNGDSPTAEPVTVGRVANSRSGTNVANVEQQQYLMDLVTHAVLPSFVDPAGNRKPFVLVFWSRDPDGTQHNQGDSIGSLTPGINGPTVTRAFQNVDNNLKQLIQYLKTTADPNAPGRTLWDNTDLFITSDHGFATVTKSAMDMQGTRAESYATRQRYRNIPAGELPLGFVAIDLAHDLDLPLFDPDQIDTRGNGDSTGIIRYRQLRILSSDTEPAEFPSSGSGLLGGGMFDKDGFDAPLLVACNGSADLIYLLPQRVRNGKPPQYIGPQLVRKVVSSLVTKPYVSGIFVDAERFGTAPGALSLAQIHFRGSARTPVPAIVVTFRSFCTDPQRPEMTGVEFSETSARTGFGVHGSFGRHTTYNCMIAFGPDFKAGFDDTDPVSNADIALTLSSLLGVDLLKDSRGALHGRILREALRDGPQPRGAERRRIDSLPTDNGTVTRLMYQVYVDQTGHRYDYLDAGGFPGCTVGVPK
jgi:hypothetical protein